MYKTSIRPTFALGYKPGTSNTVKIIDSSLIALVINDMPSGLFVAPPPPTHIISFNIF